MLRTFVLLSRAMLNMKKKLDERREVILTMKQGKSKEFSFAIVALQAILVCL